MSKSIKEILNSNEKFEELTKLAFESVDIDKNNYIDAEELEKILLKIATEMGSDPPTKNDILNILEFIDEDKSEKISYEEFKKFVKDVLRVMI